jgi:hypothetical protein
LGGRRPSDAPGGAATASGRERLHTVLRFLDDLRAAGQDRDFRDNLWNRLQDEALLDRADLAESLSEMNAGNVRAALTSDEERKGRRNRR